MPFASTLYDVSSHYGYREGTHYSANNILGAPITYPQYGDCSYAFTPREYGKFWQRRNCSKLSSRRNLEVDPQDYIEVKFRDGMFLSSISIYETFNPGSIVRILVFNVYKNRYDVVWSGKPQNLPEESREFIPPIKKPNCPVELIRLEIDHSLSKYYGGLVGIEMNGIVHPSFFSPSRMLQLERINRPHCTSDCVNYPFSMCKISIDLPGDQEQIDYFKSLSDEIVWQIFSFLDIVSLCRVAGVSKRCRDIAYDPFFYKDMYLKPFWYMISSQIFAALLSPRMELCTKLDLSWCGGCGDFEAPFFHFIKREGYKLTSLKLNNVQFVQYSGVYAILENCCNLEELELQQFSRLKADSYVPIFYACHMKLKRLDLCNANMHWFVISKILENSPKLEHLNLGYCDYLDRGNDDPLYKIICSLRHLKSLDLWRCDKLTIQQITMILDSCPQLEYLNIGWCHQFVSARNQELIDALARNGANLKCLDMSGFKKLDNVHLQTLGESCKKLEVLIIVGAKVITHHAVHKFLLMSENPKHLDISNTNVSSSAASSLRKQFPNVEIKCYYTI